jgi:hypothetical protein
VRRVASPGSTPAGAAALEFQVVEAGGTDTVIVEGQFAADIPLAFFDGLKQAVH